MRKRAISCLVLFCLVSSSVAADTWDAFVKHAKEKHGAFGHRAALFLADHRPVRDNDIDLELLIENLDYAMKARQHFPWAQQLSDEIFFNDVLPYAVLDETRESWRPMLFDIAAPIVADATDAKTAAVALNKQLFNEINVHYNTGRKKPNQSPSESIEQSRATCTGLSILLVDACRAVGIPARVSGVAEWNGKSGNHTWVEVNVGDDWQFIGADEQGSSNDLNHGWFVGQAGQAIAGDPVHGVWSTSWKKTGHRFIMAWNTKDSSIHGVEVTSTFVKDAKNDAPERTVRHLRVWKTRGGDRMIANVQVINSDDDTIHTVQTNAGTADLNDMPSVTLDAGATYRLVVDNLSTDSRTSPLSNVDAGEATIDLYWDEMSLTTDAAFIHSDIRRALKIRIPPRGLLKEAREDDVQSITVGNHEMKWLERTFGERPEGGHSLWISMHGGGGTTAKVNDQQWRNQIRLYTLDEGIYIAPRAPTDTWNLWHQGHVDGLLQAIIDQYVATNKVNVNRVYLLGYSAGGDGAYQLSPRMADRLAAASAMAGHPNETKALGLRNLPFAIFMGGNDKAYGRNDQAARWKDELAALRNDDPEGYKHRVTIYEGLGHWMNGRDAEGLPWMAKFTRNPWPQKIVWHQDDVTHTRFYWLAVREDDATARTTITATVDGQTIHITSDDISRVTLRLHDKLLDLDKPVTVNANDETVFEGYVKRTKAAIDQSFAERYDAESVAYATLEVTWDIE